MFLLIYKDLARQNTSNSESRVRCVGRSFYEIISESGSVRQIVMRAESSCISPKMEIDCEF